MQFANGTLDQRRRDDLRDQIAKIDASAPDRSTILSAIKNLEGMWEHLTMCERSRLLSQLINRIEHNPIESTLAITLSPLGLKSFNTESVRNEDQCKSQAK